MNIRSQKSTTHINALELGLGVIKPGLCAKQECLYMFPKIRYSQYLGLGSVNDPYLQHYDLHFTFSECVSYALLGFPFRYFKSFRNVKFLNSPPPTIMLVSVDIDLGITIIIYTC